MESQRVRCHFHELSSDAPVGRNFPELTIIILIWQGGGVLIGGGLVDFKSCNINNNIAVRRSFLEPSSYAPVGRNFPELTSDDRFPLRRISHGISVCTLPFPGTFFLRPRRKKLPGTDI